MLHLFNKLNRANYFYALFRIALSLPMLLQFEKVIQIFKGQNDEFTQFLVSKFSNTFLPAWSLDLYSYLMPIGQVLVGLMLFFGIFTRLAATFAIFIYATLLLGVVLAGPSMTLWTAKMMLYLICNYIIAKDNNENEKLSLSNYLTKKLS